MQFAFLIRSSLIFCYFGFPTLAQAWPYGYLLPYVCSANTFSIPKQTHWCIGVNPVEGHQDGWDSSSLCEVVIVRTGFILQDRGHLTAAFNYLMGRCEEYIARFFWDVHRDRRKTQVKLTEGSSDSILGKLCSALGQSNTGKSCPEQLWSLHRWRYSKFRSNWATWTVLSQITHTGPFKSKLLYDVMFVHLKCAF